MSSHSTGQFISKMIKTVWLAFLSLPTYLKIIVISLILIGTISFSISLQLLNQKMTIEIPKNGGSITEGVIGYPRFVNPLLATTEADRDLTTVIYSGLMRFDSNGELIPDLALDYEISENKLTYTFNLKPDLTWHDDKPLTTTDIVFTVNRLKDPTLFSPNQIIWQDIKVEAITKETVTFTLSKPIPGFLAMATIGLLPAHLWQNVDTNNFAFNDLTLRPIGSGPYLVKNIKTDIAGSPTNYSLQSFPNFALGQPAITNLNFNFYPTEEALIEAYTNKKITSMNSVSPTMARSLKLTDARIITTPLPRVFGFFFNHNKNPIFTQKTVREALNLVIDKDFIVRDILDGYGLVLNGPLSPQTKGYVAISSTNLKTEERLIKARDLLLNDGWSLNETGILTKTINGQNLPLRFTITVPDVPELILIANQAKDTWQKIGAVVSLETTPPADLNQNIIRPRNYDILLFGLVVGHEADLYSFWHSSQRNDPGLNISSYTNPLVDNLLEKLKNIPSGQEREKLLNDIQITVANDYPAIFMYSPYFIYAAPNNVKNLKLNYLSKSSDRLLDIHKWYINTEQIWPFFVS